MSKALIRIALLGAPLLLAACGDGWEAQRTDTYLPYGNSRTAGTGVVYVRAKMLPKKELVVEPVMEEVKAEDESSSAEPVLQAEEIFSEAQRKGHSTTASEEEDVASGDAAEEVDEDDSVAEVTTAPHEEPTAEEAMEEEESSSDDEEIGEVSEEEKHSGLIKNYKTYEDTVSTSMSAEDYIAQAPKNIVSPKVDVIEKTSDTSTEVLKTAEADSYYSGEVVEVYENIVVQPQKEIIVPKRDSTAYLSVGEETLDEIYNNPF